MSLAYVAQKCCHSHVGSSALLLLTFHFLMQTVKNFQSHEYFKENLNIT